MAFSFYLVLLLVEEGVIVKILFYLFNEVSTILMLQLTFFHGFKFLNLADNIMDLFRPGWIAFLSGLIPL